SQPGLRWPDRLLPRPPAGSPPFSLLSSPVLGSLPSSVLPGLGESFLHSVLARAAESLARQIPAGLRGTGGPAVHLRVKRPSGAVEGSIRRGVPVRRRGDGEAPWRDGGGSIHPEVEGHLLGGGVGGRF